MTQLFLPAELITVTLSRDFLPERFTWQGRQYQVYRITHHWRVRLGWWQEPVHREFYRLATHEKLLVILYCDLLEEQWYLLRIYD